MRKSVAVLIGAVLGAALTTPALMKTESVTGQLIGPVTRRTRATRETSTRTEG
jgi:hypothetical protein